MKDTELPDCSVGYRQPPLQKRFKKNLSGNPRGRPKGSKNRKTVLRNIMYETLVVTENGKRRRRTTLELLLVTLRNLSLKGNVRATRVFWKYLEKYAPQESHSGAGYIVVPAEMSPEEWTADQMEKNKTRKPPPGAYGDGEND